MKDTKTILTHYDLILYETNIKNIKYFYISRFVGKRLKEKIVYNENDVEGYITRYIGNIKDYRLNKQGANFDDFIIEVETKNGIVFISLCVVYEV